MQDRETGSLYSVDEQNAVQMVEFVLQEKTVRSSEVFLNFSNGI